MCIRVLEFGDPCPTISLIIFTLRDVLCTNADNKKTGENVLTTLEIVKVWVKYEQEASVQIYWPCRTK
jgi:hypothetical protein